MMRTLKHAHTLADKYDNEQLDVMHVLAGPKDTSARLIAAKVKREREKKHNTDVTVSA